MKKKIIVKPEYVLLFLILLGQYIVPLLRAFDIIQCSWVYIIVIVYALSTLELLIAIIAMRELMELCNNKDLQ